MKLLLKFVIVLIKIPRPIQIQLSYTYLIENQITKNLQKTKHSKKSVKNKKHQQNKKADKSVNVLSIQIIEELFAEKGQKNFYDK